MNCKAKGDLGAHAPASLRISGAVEDLNASQ